MKLRRLISNEPRLAERIDVDALDAVGLRLHARLTGKRAHVADRATIRTTLKQAAEAVDGHKFGMQFLLAEWDDVVDAWQLTTWDAYRDAPRLGRKTRLPESKRATLWSIFEAVRASLQSRNLMTMSGVFTMLAAVVTRNGRAPYDFAVVDEAQDISVGQLRFLAALGVGRPNALFFAGDLGQRIFKQPFSWKAVGVDVRGRSRTLTVNYRTSHQIRTQADRLLGATVSDIDGNAEDRTGTVSVFNGSPPAIRSFRTEEAERDGVAVWLTELAKSGVQPHEIGVFVRSTAQVDRATAAVRAAGHPLKVLDEHVDTAHGHISVGTMHLAKGLEFRAVVVMACDDEVIPLQERIETVGDDADLEEVYNTERHLLYVACTRARDQLLVTGVEPTSEFLADILT